MNDIDIIEQLACIEARDSFWAFRQYINPNMKKGWWQREIARELQLFYDDVIAGKKPKLVIQAPPQHGKSVQIIEFIAWLAGKDPNKRAIYTSFSERLGIRANLRLQRLYDSEKYKCIFPETRLNTSNVVTISGQYLRNREILEYAGKEGFFRNTTVRGSITGESLDLGIIDDPVKGREEAGSLTIRDKTWEWLTDDFFTRFSEDGGLLAILTRWHIDDPIGRLLIAMPEVKVLSYPAIAVKDEKHRKQGEPLFPEHKSLEFLKERKAMLGTASFEALYQQNPIVIGGEVIKGQWFKRVGMPPKILWRKIYGDTAQKTAERNDYSVFECWGYGEDNKIYLLDLLRGKWEAPDLKRRAIDFWQKHIVQTDYGSLREFMIEDKSSGTGLIQDLMAEAKIPIKGIARTRDKYQRVLDVIPRIEAGYVCLVDGKNYLSDFIAECEAFTADDSHQFDDQIDPMCDAINDMLISKEIQPRIRRL
jgi:predicted phage terminase large subunit-like protein